MTDIGDFLVTMYSAMNDKSLRETEKAAPAIPDNLSPTAKKLASMFMEHVGTNILDSGGAYGYGYQRDRENPVWDKPESWAEFFVRKDGVLDITPYTSLYHLLVGQLTYDESADQKFQEWSRQEFEDGESWEEHLSEFPDPDNPDSFCDKWLGEYTYNGENTLDHNFIYYASRIPGWDYVIIQIHNGCDARWGFTNPVLFRVNYDFFPYPIVSLGCTNCGKYWRYECYSCIDTDADQRLEDYPAIEGEEGKVGTVVVNKNGEAFCPCCGKGKIE